jgi:hypothetical protein
MRLASRPYPGSWLWLPLSYSRLRPTPPAPSLGRSAKRQSANSWQLAANNNNRSIGTGYRYRYRYKEHKPRYYQLPATSCSYQLPEEARARGERREALGAQEQEPRTENRATRHKRIHRGCQGGWAGLAKKAGSARNNCGFILH